MIVCVGIPSIDGKPCAQTVDSLLAEHLLAGAQGVHLLVQWQIGVSLIGLARNLLARQFLDIAEADCMVFVDADISWPAGDLLRLVRTPFDVCGASYRAKQDEVKFHVYGEIEPDGDYYRVGGLPGGFLKVTRRAYEAIAADQYYEVDGRVLSDYFPTGIRDGVLYGEDYGFCRLWRDHGGDVMLDPTIAVRHHDGRTAYAGDVGAWLEERLHVTGE